MIEKGWVRTKHDVYWLTPEGRDVKVFGYYYGRVLWEELMAISFKGSFEEKLEEYVKRVGIYVTYIFMRNSNRAGIKPQYNVGREMIMTNG